MGFLCLFVHLEEVALEDETQRDVRYVLLIHKIFKITKGWRNEEMNKKS